MKTLNPELQQQIDALARLSCDLLERKKTGGMEEAQPLIEVLVRGGYQRLSDVNLQTRLEQRAVGECRSTAIHRRTELTGIIKQMQDKFDELVTWETSQPQAPSGTSPANISSQTDA